MCERCQTTHKRATLKDRADPAGKPTFLKASPGTSFTLQLPARALAVRGAAGDARAVVRAGGEPDAPAPLSARFAVTLELRVEIFHNGQWGLRSSRR